MDMNMNTVSPGLPETTQPSRVVGEEEIKKAIEVLKKYAYSKAPLDDRIVQEEQWYRLRHWEQLRKQKGEQLNPGDHSNPKPEPASAWLFNSILGKHADMMDNYPVPVFLPREASDEEEARMLSSVVPVILERNRFRKTYSEAMWYHLPHGMSAYCVTWDPTKENGLGDVSVTKTDILKLFWDLSVSDIQDSPHFFVLEMWDNEVLRAEYPQLPPSVYGSSPIRLGEYVLDEYRDPDTGREKTMVVDWYTKKYINGRCVLCYTKFVGEGVDGILYSSQDDPTCEDGYYIDGKYPFVLPVLYPVEGTALGFGLIAVGQTPQMYIDRMDQNFILHMDRASRVRYIGKASAGINKEDFANPNIEIIECAGDVDEEHLRQITVNPLDSIYYQMKLHKIDELKETTANRDVNQGGTTGGVTAASAILALQQEGNKTSRDIIANFYDAFESIVGMVVDRIRQFYTEERMFRIVGANGSDEYVSFSGRGLNEKPVGHASNGSGLVRQPIFDIKIHAQKKNPFSQLSQNENAKELFKMGVFNPEAAQQVLPMLEIMDFEGIDKVRENVRQGATLLNTVHQMQAEMDRMAAVIQMLSGRDLGLGGGDNGAQQSSEVDSNGTDGGQVTVVYGRQAADINSPSAGENASAESAPTKSELFAQMINGEYKDEYTKAVQKIINKRFREAKTTQETLASHEQLISILSQRYGTDDVKKLAEHLQSDNALWQDLADEQGLTVAQQQELMRLKMSEQEKERALNRYRKAEEKRMRVEKWKAEAEALKAKYPAFDLDTEVDNEYFVQLVRSGVPMEHAYTVVHLNDIMGGAMQATKQQTEANVVANIRARGMRPQENGSKRSGGVVYKTDPSKFTKADREAILKRMAKGEQFEF